jgi:hypothetical protein
MFLLSFLPARAYRETWGFEDYLNLAPRLN